MQLGLQQKALVGNGLSLQDQLALVGPQGVEHGVDLRDDGALGLLALQDDFLHLNAGVLQLAAFGPQKQREGKIDAHLVVVAAEIVGGGHLRLVKITLAQEHAAHVELGLQHFAAVPLLNAQLADFGFELAQRGVLGGGKIGEAGQLGAAHAIEGRGLGDGVGGQLGGLAGGRPEVVGEDEAGVLQVYAQLLGLHLAVLHGNLGLYRVDGGLVANLGAAGGAPEAPVGQRHAFLNKGGLPEGVVPVPVVFGGLQPHFVYLLHALGFGGALQHAGLAQGAAAGVNQQALANGHGEADASQAAAGGAAFGVHVGAHVTVVAGFQVDAAGPEWDFQLVAPVIVVVGAAKLLAVEIGPQLGVEAAPGLQHLAAGLVAEQGRLLHDGMVGEDQVGQVLEREYPRRVAGRSDA